MHIDNIKEIGWIMNSDGMDFICCRDVLVENTFQRNYDDNVTIKAFNATPEYIASHTNTDGSYSDGAIWMVAGLRDFEVCNYEIRNCVFWADKAHNMLVGPEARGIAFRNIRFHDNIVLENRQNGRITGVKDIKSFDEKEILLFTQAGKLVIKGEQLHVKQLDLEKGEVDLEGKVDSLTYLSKNTDKKEESLLKRMFR